MSRTKRIAYFSMGTGLFSGFKTYGGGLEMLAGDMEKEVVNYGLNSIVPSNTYIEGVSKSHLHTMINGRTPGDYPMVFFHILWKHGYSYQHVNDDGSVIDVENNQNHWQKYVKDTGKTTSVKLLGKDIKIKIWKFVWPESCIAFKNAPNNAGDIYFLDADLDENGDFRNLTHKLYGGSWADRNGERIAQEIILGVGAIRALDVLGIHVDGYHYNDGHPAFAGIELISRKKMEYAKNYPTLSNQEIFEMALKWVKSHTVFTTHTNVPAGNETHPVNDLTRFGANISLSFDEMVQVGGDPFGMTVASLRLSCAANGVSRLQTNAANEMWSWVKGAPHIISITNGVNQHTWQCPYIENDMYLPRTIFETHMGLKQELIWEIEERTGTKFRQNSVLVAFARRATEYKRWNLIFSNRDHFKELVDKFDMQVIFTGKSHRNDGSGKYFISEVAKLSKEYPNNVVFLEGYDIELAKKLVSSVDIWLNNPRVPYEACGTSGMKAAMNGVLNVSTLDGWWREGALDDLTGWSIVSELSYEQMKDNTKLQDISDANALYKLLKDEVFPTYYDDKEYWATMMIASIATACTQFTTKRMLEDYYTNLYSQVDFQDV